MFQAGLIQSRANMDVVFTENLFFFKRFMLGVYV